MATDASESTRTAPTILFQEPPNIGLSAQKYIDVNHADSALNNNVVERFYYNSGLFF